MSMIETMTETQDRMVSELQASQERLVGYNQRMAEMVKGMMPTQMFGESMPAVPGMDELPKPTELVDSYFEFAGKLADANQAFVNAVVEAWTPEED